MGANWGNDVPDVVKLVIGDVYLWVVVEIILSVCTPSEVPYTAPLEVEEVELLAPSEVPQASPLEVAEVVLMVLDA